MGILDFLASDDAKLGLGLLAASGPSMVPMNAAQRVQGAYGLLQEQKSAQETQAFERQKNDRQRRDWSLQDQISALAPQFYQPGSPGSPGTAAVNGALPADLQIGAQAPRAATAPGFDTQGYVRAVMGIDPVKGLALQQSLAKQTNLDKVDPGKYTPDSLARFAQTGDYGALKPRDKVEFIEGFGVNPFDQSNVGRALPNPNKPFSLDSTGAAVPNTMFQNYELGKASAGAARTSVNINNKLGEGVAAQVGPMIRESSLAAEGAAKQVDAANRIVQAVDSNKLFTGPGANAKLTVAQVSDALGLGGNTNLEKIGNTRQVLQGLAQLTLQGRAQMRGQGAITESESALAQRATSGDISMTAGEIKQLANAAKRAANYTQAEHQRKLGLMRSNPALSDMAGYYDVSPVPAQGGGKVVNFGDLK